MFDQLMKYADAPARALLAMIFILAGVGKVGAFESTQAYMESFGLPAVLLIPTILFEIGAGLLVLIGLGTRYVAIFLAGFTIVSAVVFHFDFADQVQQVMFLKNLAIAGGLLLLAKHGAQSLSVDGMFAAKLQN